MGGRDFRVAFLGPLGTYSHQAAYDKFGTAVEYHESRTIAEVFDAVASNIVHAGVVPQENSIFGGVIETYDKLRQPNVGFVRGDVVLEVQHCLLVRRGVKAEDITCIKSHEQALGQCRGFLAQNFSSASLEKVASTAAAAQAVLTSNDCAAICSRLCATIFDGLEILFEGIQDRSCNFTRFFILSPTQQSELPPSSSPIGSETRSLVRLSSKEMCISQVLAALNMLVSRLDRRPQLESSGLSQDVYFAELTKGDSDSPWILEVSQALQRVRASGGKAEMLGIW
ncbi:Prephenate dehydratase domain-containing protein [Favolaschia claudopus]|uniref:prephenate dehydratase n=1 Tax=Favolaschia claudopus TaxID=2862362 RepID=A0AAW0BB59_9AGAR